MVSIIEIKPKKAKYAFKVPLNNDLMDNMVFLSTWLIGPRNMSSNPKQGWWLETYCSMGVGYVTVYTNDESIYQRLKQALDTK